MTVTQSEAMAALYSMFTTSWSTPYVLDQEKSGLEQGDADWVRFFVRHRQDGAAVTGRDNAATMGPRGQRRYHRGIQVVIQVFTASTGRAPFDKLCDEARALFEGRRIANDVVVNSGVTDDVEMNDGKWRMGMIVFDGFYTERN